MMKGKRTKTTYPGVYYREAARIGGGGKERVYYVVYKKAGKIFEEKAGRQYADAMTPARAAGIRAELIEGKRLSRKEQREQTLKEKKERKWTIHELWERYKEDKSDIKGLKQDDYRYGKYIKPRFGKMTPVEITQFEMDRMRINLLKSKAPQTVKHILSQLERIIRFGQGKGLCDALPFKVNKPRVKNKVTEDLTPEQLKYLLIAIEADENEQAKAMIKMVLFTGMRHGEILKLQWEDVDFNRGFITIRDPKGGVEQKIPLNDVARELLKSLPRAENSPYIFPGPSGKPKPTINRLFTRRIKQRAGLPEGFRPMHGLRHVFASMLASSGEVDMYQLQKLLTHKDPRMTQRYAHLRDEALKRASGVANDILKSILNPEDKEKVVNLEDHNNKT